MALLCWLDGTSLLWSVDGVRQQQFVGAATKIHREEHLQQPSHKIS